MTESPAFKGSDPYMGGGFVFHVSERERQLLIEILKLRKRGWGTYRIGGMLFPADRRRTAQKRVQRILDRARQMGVPVNNPDQALALLRKDTEVKKALQTSICLRLNSEARECEDKNVSMDCWNRELGSSLRRLGQTERLVLNALYVQGGRAEFSAIVREALELLGLDPGNKALALKWRNRLWQALRRLRKRGIVDSCRGIYWLKTPIKTGLYVENFRAKNKRGEVVQVWNKRLVDRPAELSEALLQATLLEAGRTLQVEIAMPIDDPFIAELMGSLGISEVRIYRDPYPPYRGVPKVEVALSHPPLKPNIMERENWIKAFKRIIYELCIRILQLLRHAGF